MFKRFNKGIRIFTIGVILANLSIFPRQIQSENSLRLLGEITKTNQGRAFIVDTAMMRKYAFNYDATDPNFPNDGVQQFSGITIKKLLQLAGAKKSITGVTFIGKDQYITYAPVTILTKFPVFVAFRINGQKIKKRRGGPLKLIYPQEAGVPIAAYNWYLDTIVIGNLSPRLTVQYGTVRKTFTDKEINALPNLTRRHSLPIPRGFAAKLTPPAPQADIRGVLLADLLKRAGASERSLVLYPLVGKELRLDADSARLPLFIAIRMNGAPIHIAYGGPYPLIFPIERFPELKSKIPDSGAFFLLDRIQVR